MRAVIRSAVIMGDIIAKKTNSTMVESVGRERQRGLKFFDFRYFVSQTRSLFKLQIFCGGEHFGFKFFD